MATTPVGFETREHIIAGVLELRQKMNIVLDQIKDGSRSKSSVLQPTEEFALSYIYVVKALESFSDVGKIRARQVLDEMKISHKLKLGDLADDERMSLLRRIQ
ncbi:MAG: hypothetical protein EBU22_00620 [Actinobacteria bacterium]|nr:hypothetical protein [Actinomycetota bacterium]